MLTASDYYRYARECYDFALKARTESVRHQFLDMTKMWVTAAQELEGNSASSAFESSEAAEPLTSQAPGPDDGKKSEPGAQLVRDAVAKLPPDHRE